MFHYTNVVTWILLATCMFNLSMLSLILIYCVVFTAAVAQVQNCSRTYKVQPGDFCDGISAVQNVST